MRIAQPAMFASVLLLSACVGACASPGPHWEESARVTKAVTQPPASDWCQRARQARAATTDPRDIAYLDRRLATCPQG